MTLSQNFIKSSELVNQLLSISSLNSSDLVVEIGPGKGIITNKLIKIVNNVIAIEKDYELFIFLQNKFFASTNLQIINQDFLTWNLPKVPYKIFSNIPFTITSDILTKILKSHSKPTEIYLIMQQEAIDKFYPSDSFNNQDAILMQPYYDIEILGDIDRSAFTPKPQVDIVFVKFKLKKSFLIDETNYQQFCDFVIFGFNQWKPNIFEIYKKIFSYDQFKKINHQFKLNYLKPSQLNFDQWHNLFKIFIKFVSPQKQKYIDGFEKIYHSKIKNN
jgi:23S rRNA (adenine-N6)-dimethyltransferase